MLLKLLHFFPSAHYSSNISWPFPSLPRQEVPLLFFSIAQIKCFLPTLFLRNVLDPDVIRMPIRNSMTPSCLVSNLALFYASNFLIIINTTIYLLLSYLKFFIRLSLYHEQFSAGFTSPVFKKWLVPCGH